MGLNEKPFDDAPVRYKIVGPGEYYVPVVLLDTTDRQKAEDYFRELVADAANVDQEGLKKVPYCLYRCTQEPMQWLNMGDQPDA